MYFVPSSIHRDKIIPTKIETGLNLLSLKCAFKQLGVEGAEKTLEECFTVYRIFDIFDIPFKTSFM